MTGLIKIRNTSISVWDFGRLPDGFELEVEYTVSFDSVLEVMNIIRTL